MREPRRPDEGDVSGGTGADIPAEEDFLDWDNPEDFDEDAPEGYYDDDDEGYIPTEDDPDYDLSEAAGYSGWDDNPGGGLMPQWAVVAISMVLVIAIVGSVLIAASR